MKKVILLILFVLAVGTAHAQMPTTIHNTSGETLDDEAILAAAQPLRDEGASVAVILVANGGQEDVIQQLQDLDLANGEEMRRDLIAVYVSLEPRYVEIRWGSNWDRYLADKAASIRADTTTPQLRERQFTTAYVETLGAIKTAIAPTLLDQVGEAMPFLFIVGIIGLSIWGAATGKLGSGGSSSSSSWDDSSSSSSSSSSDYDSGGGSDGGDW